MTSQLEAILAQADHIDRIIIDLKGGGFVWRIVADGQEVFSGPAGPDQIAGMLKATSILIHTELGVPSPDLLAQLN